METTQVSTVEWKDKENINNVMEYCSTIKKNEIMPFAIKWMDREDITLCDISQKEKDIPSYHITSLLSWF